MTADGSATVPEWWAWMEPEDRALYARAGYQARARLRGRPALLVIDAIVGFTGSRPLPIAEAVAEHPTSCGQRAWDALPQVELLLAAFRAAGAPVVFTRPDRRAQAAIGRATTRAAQRARPAAQAAEPAAGRSSNDAARSASASADAFLYAVAPADGEWVCEKARASAFHGTPLEAFLRVRDVSTLVVCGGTTSGCVRASSVDAFSAGFTVAVADDACFDRARQPHLANLFDLNAKYAAVLPAATIASHLAHAPGTGAVLQETA